MYTKRRIKQGTEQNLLKYVSISAKTSDINYSYFCRKIRDDILNFNKYDEIQVSLFCHSTTTNHDYFILQKPSTQKLEIYTFGTFIY